MRLFISINLNRKMKDALLDIQDDMRFFGVRGNFTREENMHLTLAFIGEFSDPEYVLDVMDTIEFEPFEISLEGIGSFHRLWWAGISGSKPLMQLVKKLRRELAQAGIPFDRKKFKPHITLIRKSEIGKMHSSNETPNRPKESSRSQRGSKCGSRESASIPPELVENAEEYKDISMTVDHISLMRSDRGKNGMIYTELR